MKNSKGKNFFIFYLCSGKPSSHRFIRIEEEAKKRNLNFQPINLYRENFFTDRGLLNSEINEIIKFNKRDAFLSFSNSLESHFLLSFLDSVGAKKAWPSYHSTIFADKFYTNYFFTQNNVTTPKTTLLVDKREISEQAKLVGGFPCVAKNSVGTEGISVRIVNSDKEMLGFIEEELTRRMNLEKIKIPNTRFSFILQEYIKEAKGSDYRVLCLGNEIVGGIKRTSQTDDFRANVSLGGKAEDFEVPKELKKICEKTMKKGKLFYAGLDFIKREDEWVAIEINTSAQFKGFEEATGINVAGKIIDKLLKK